ncbi:WXG100-like domain-containing protein [Actinoplanes awajinensis]|uniref:Outer membrane channel protein CpnT-like N-terminal domain-containing protein n=1 Tax=Actinoplanes awajinensis subsp. mycoplanecinus TaxID=135947 RepID=A0A117MM71_9ACTN|nr:hypothetical protein [Actinoplanes awajinensis]KUL25027.1 hypothetical protein ADL15_42970 [Actinoplanes awajinensis subsp. mycoplanecinus]
MSSGDDHEILTTFLDWFTSIEEHIPGARDKVGEILLGALPLARANDLYDLAAQWGDLAGTLNDAYEDIAQAANGILENWTGDESSAQFAQQWFDYLDGLRQTAVSAEQLQASVQKVGLEVELMKFMAFVNLAMLAASLFMLIVAMIPSGGGSLALAPGMYTTCRKGLMEAAAATVRKIASISLRTSLKSMKNLFHGLPGALGRGVPRAITAGRNVFPRVAGALRGKLSSAALRQAAKTAIAKGLTNVTPRALISRGISKAVAQKLAAKELRRFASDRITGTLNRQTRRELQRELARDVRRQLMEKWTKQKIAQKAASTTAEKETLAELKKMAARQVAEKGLGPEFAKYVGTRAGFGAMFMGGFDVLGQGLQGLSGNRTEMDWAHARNSAVQGAAFGAGMFGGPLGHAFGGALAGGAVALGTEMGGADGINWTAVGHGAMQGAEAGVILGGQTHLESSHLGGRHLRIGEDIQVLPGAREGDFTVVSARAAHNEKLTLTSDGEFAWQTDYNGGRSGQSEGFQPPPATGPSPHPATTSPGHVTGMAAASIAATSAPTPRTEAPAPRTEAPAPRTEPPAPRTEAPAPRTEAPAPRPETPARPDAGGRPPETIAARSTGTDPTQAAANPNAAVPDPSRAVPDPARVAPDLSHPTPDPARAAVGAGEPPHGEHIPARPDSVGTDRPTADGNPPSDSGPPTSARPEHTAVAVDRGSDTEPRDPRGGDSGVRDGGGHGRDLAPDSGLAGRGPTPDGDPAGRGPVASHDLGSRDPASGGDVARPADRAAGQWAVSDSGLPGRAGGELPEALRIQEILRGEDGPARPAEVSPRREVARLEPPEVERLGPDLADGRLRARGGPEQHGRWAAEHLSDRTEAGGSRPKPGEEIARTVDDVADQAADHMTPRPDEATSPERAAHEQGRQDREVRPEEAVDQSRADAGRDGDQVERPENDHPAGHDPDGPEPRRPGEPRTPLRDFFSEAMEASPEWNEGVRREFARELSGRDFAGLDVRVDHVRAGSRSLDVAMSVVDPATGEKVGVIDRRIGVDRSTGGIEVQHLRFDVKPEYQNLGFGRAFNDHMEGWYVESGVDRIVLQAGKSVGGYAWARAGYDWHNNSDYQAKDVLSRLEAAVGNLQKDLDLLVSTSRRGAWETVGNIIAKHGYPDAASAFEGMSRQKDEASSVLDRGRSLPYRSPRFPTPHEISQVGRTDQGGTSATWIGKRAMLGSGWHGAKVPEMRPEAPLRAEPAASVARTDQHSRSDALIRDGLDSVVESKPDAGLATPHDSPRRAEDLHGPERGDGEPADHSETEPYAAARREADSTGQEYDPFRDTGESYTDADREQMRDRIDRALNPGRYEQDELVGSPRDGDPLVDSAPADTPPEGTRQVPDHSTSTLSGQEIADHLRPRLGNDLADGIGRVMERDAAGSDLAPRLNTPGELDRTSAALAELAAGDALEPSRGWLEKFNQLNPGAGRLFEPVADHVNRLGSGADRAREFADMIRADDPARDVGPHPDAGQRALVADYAARMEHDLAPVAEAEASTVGGEAARQAGGDVRLSIRSRDASSLHTEVDRLVKGSWTEPGRPEARVGDVLDPVTVRLTVSDMTVLDAVYENVRARFGVGDGGRILHVDNTYAHPRPGLRSPAERGISVIIRAEVEGRSHTYELELRTERAGLAADLKDVMSRSLGDDLSSEQARAIDQMVREAAALDQLESRSETIADAESRAARDAAKRDAEQEIRQQGKDKRFQESLVKNDLVENAMFEGLNGLDRGKAAEALSHLPNKMTSELRKRVFGWASDQADGDVRVFANRVEFARARWNEMAGDREKALYESARREDPGIDPRGFKTEGQKLATKAMDSDEGIARLKSDLEYDLQYLAGKPHSIGLPEQVHPDLVASRLVGIEHPPWEMPEAEAYHVRKHFKELPDEDMFAGEPIDIYTKSLLKTLLIGEITVEPPTVEGESTAVIYRRAILGSQYTMRARVYLGDDGSAVVATYGRAEPGR